VTFSTDDLRTPRSVAALQQLVADSPRIRVLGTGHSFNTIADTTGTLVSLARLTDLEHIKVLPAARAVDVRGAISYGDLGRQLNDQGSALGNLGSLPHISVAGACATATHGSGASNRALSAAVGAVEFVRANGELEILMRGDDGFEGAVVALGALGIVTRLRLDVQPAYEVRQDGWVDLPSTADLLEVLRSAYSVSVFTMWRRSDVFEQVWVKTRLDGTAEVPDGSEWGARPAPGPLHPVPGLDPVHCTEQGGVPGPWIDRLPHFRHTKVPSAGDEQQSEYLMPVERLPDAVDAVRSVADRFVDHLLTSEIRLIAADDQWLSPARGRDSAAIHFTWKRDVALSAIDAVESALAPCDPRPHWGKVFLMAPERVAAAYPALDRFRALVDKYDPERKLGNDFLERYVY
jgi:xylitol oxidase